MQSIPYMPTCNMMPLILCFFKNSYFYFYFFIYYLIWINPSWIWNFFQQMSETNQMKIWSALYSVAWQLAGVVRTGEKSSALSVARRYSGVATTDHRRLQAQSPQPVKELHPSSGEEPVFTRGSHSRDSCVGLAWLVWARFLVKLFTTSKGYLALPGRPHPLLPLTRPPIV